MQLELRNVTVEFGPTVALRDITIQVGTGQFVSLIGPNGAGKSTTTLLAAGSVNARSGEIIYEGKDLAGVSPEDRARLGMSLVPEGRHVFTRLTVLENLMVANRGGSINGNFDAKCATVFDYFPILYDRRSTMAGTLSGGEQQQLVIARALITEPRLMIIDEPSLGLAPIIVDQVYEILLRLQKVHKLSLLIVEQNIDRALQSSDYIYVLRNGTVRFQGNPQKFEDKAAAQKAFLGFN